MARQRGRRITATGAAAVLVLGLAACGGGSAAPSAAPSAGGPQQGGGQQGQGPGPGEGGGVVGLVAAVTGTTMQVQSDVQTAVTWTGTTTVSRVVTTDLSGVGVGSCVMAVVPEDATDATSVTVTAPVDGACTGVGGFPGGGFPGGGRPGEMPAGMPSGQPGEMPSGAPAGQPGEMPSGMPSGAPSGMPSGGAGLGSFVVGQVTAVSGSTISVDQDGTAGSVTVGSATTITTTQAADASAITVGLCVSARGAADTRGGLTATSLTLSDAVDGACTRAGGARG